MSNATIFAQDIAYVNRKAIFGIPKPIPELETIVVPLNKYMILHGLANSSNWTADEDIVMQNIFDSLSVLD